MGLAAKKSSFRSHVENLMPRTLTLTNTNVIGETASVDQDELIGESEAVRSIADQVEWFSASDAPVLITGESGTGKEVISRMIHSESNRCGQRYVRVNCAALSETLIESELFGHERGAFTGAFDSRIGRFEWAGQGTLLLDEISEIPPTLQAKLLRVLEEEEFQRVGSNDSLPMRARIVATSNRSLEEEVSKGRFREDLYYRLNVLQVRVPPLRERAQDIPLLVRYFMSRFQHEGRGRVSQVHPAAMDVMCGYAWPGNVRQLKNVVRRVCILSRSTSVGVVDLGFLAESGESAVPPDLFEKTLREAERHLIQHALKRFHGNRTAAARHLGVTSRTLHNRLKLDPDLVQ